MGMFEGRFKFRRHHDFRMDAGPIKSTYRPRNPQEFDGNYIVAENLENQDYSKYLRSIAEEHCFEDFLLTVIPEEDCQELKDRTLSDDKKEDYYRRYSEEYKKYFEEYFEEYLVEYKAEYSIQVTASKPTKWQLGGSCFSDRLFDFKSVANTQEVLLGVLFSICAFIPIFLFSLISWWGDLLLLIFAIIILIGYSSLLVRHLNYRGWSKVKGLALPVVSAVVCLVILGTGVSETLNHGGDSFDNLIESILLPTILQDIVLMVYLFLLACIKNKQGQTTNLKA